MYVNIEKVEPFGPEATSLSMKDNEKENFVNNFIVKWIAAVSACVSSKAAMVVSAAYDYDLIVIDDGEVPLASGFGKPNYYIVTLLVIFVAAIIITLFLWLTKRAGYTKRLSELSEKSGCEVSHPITIRALKDEIRRVEAEMASGMV